MINYIMVDLKENNCWTVTAFWEDGHFYAHFFNIIKFDKALKYGIGLARLYCCDLKVKGLK